jgi:hypothetical protein
VRGDNDFDRMANKNGQKLKNEQMFGLRQAEVIGVPVGRELPLDAPQLFLGVTRFRMAGP